MQSDAQRAGSTLTASIAWFLGIISVLAAPPAFAQAWPDRPVKLIVPFPAGGSNDVAARLFAKHFSEALGQPFVVENRAGANGNLGAASVAAAAPDGYTLLFTTTGPLVFNKVIYKASTTFDPARDFTPIVEVTQLPLIIAANATLPAKTFPEMVAYAKAHPGKITFASSGVGSMGHLTGDLLETNLGFQMTHVAYRGSAPALNDLLGGVVNISIDLASNYAPHVKSGALRALAITTLKRWPLLPGVPTLSELGMPNFDATGWMAIVGPAGLPPDIVAKVNKAANDYLASKEGADALDKLGMVPVGGTPNELRTFMAAELAKWTPAAAKVQPE
jgi:tripartite-type tricarboxylate transporter receptor subunit TctC